MVVLMLYAVYAIRRQIGIGIELLCGLCGLCYVDNIDAGILRLACAWMQRREARLF